MSFGSIVSGSAAAEGETGQLLERRWLKNRFDKAVADGVKTIVFAAAPGMGKSSFLKSLAQEHEGSVYVEIRRPLATDTARGFWSVVLSQLDLDGVHIPQSPYEAAALAKIHLPLRGRMPRVVIIDALERAPELIDSAGLAGLDDIGEGIILVIGTRPGRHVDILEAAGARVEWIDGTSRESREELISWVDRQLPGSSREVIEGLVESSEGNYLVAQHLCSAVRSHGIEPHEITSTPGSLEAALSVLWEEQYEHAPFEVHDDLVMVSCLIAEAGEPLPDSSIADFLSLSAGRVDRALIYLRPLLRPCRRGEGLSFFSKRLGRLIAKRYRRDLVQVHEKVISFFRDSYPSWDIMDDRYGWFYLGYHCDRLARTSRKKDFSTLHWLGEGPYIKTKLVKTRSLSAVLRDLSRCLKAALEERDLPRIVSYGLRIPRLRAKEVMNGLHDLADAGEFELAADRAMLLHRESSRLKALLLLAWQSQEEGQIEMASSLISRACEIEHADMISEDRLLFAFIMADLLKYMPLSSLAPLLLNCRNPRHSVSVAWRISIMDKLSKQERMEVIKLAIRCARNVQDREEREKCITRLGNDMNALRQAKHIEIGLGKALVSEVNAVDLYSESDEKLEEMLTKIAEVPEEEQAQTFREALEFIGSYKDEPQRTEAVARLVVELVKYNETDWLLPSFEDLITAIVAIYSPVYRQKAVISSLRLITGVPRRKGWRDVFVRLGAVIETIDDPSLRVGAWVWMALARYEARDYKGAQDTLTLSSALAFHIEDLEEQAKALSLLSSCAAAIGCQARARSLSFHALQAWEAPAESRVDAETKSAMVVGISANISEERSLEYYDSSIKAALEIPDMRIRATLLAALAGNLYKMGEEDWGRRTRDKALDVARSMEAGASQAVTLAQLAVQESLCGNVASSDQILNEAEASARAEDDPEKRREAMLSIASSRRTTGSELGARSIILEIIGELEKLSSRDLSKASDLWTLSKLIKEPKSKEILTKLIKKLHRSSRSITVPERQEALLLVIRCWLAMNEAEEAKSVYTELTDIEARVQAKISLAVSSIRTSPDEAIKMLKSISIFSERMRGVQECCDELMRSSAYSRRKTFINTLAELTLMAVEDEKCADILISKWVSLSADRKAITEALSKIGYPLKDVLTGQVNEAPLGGD